MDLSLTELCTAIQSGSITPTQAVEAALVRIERLNPAVNAFVYICAEAARTEAARQTRQLAARPGSLGPLAGVPFGVKDLEDVRGLPTSYGAAPLRDNIECRWNEAGCRAAGITAPQREAIAPRFRDLSGQIPESEWRL